MRIITRAEWGAQHGRGSDVSHLLPWGEVVVHTEAGAIRDQDWPEIVAASKVLSLTELQHTQAIERYHSVTLGWNGIGYSFIIHRDGTICEGRGWGRSGAHTETRNSTAMAICFIGHGDLQPATEAQWLAAEWLIREGIRLGHLTPNPIITGHRNYSTKGKSCPGDLIYPHLGRLRNTTQEDTLSAAEVTQIKAHVDAAHERTRKWIKEEIYRNTSVLVKEIRAGRVDAAALAEQLATRLPATSGPVKVADIEAALRSVLGSLDEGDG